MTATIVDVATGSVSAGTSYTITPGAAILEGDLLLLIHCQNVSGAPTLPTDFATAAVDTQKFQGTTLSSYGASGNTGGNAIWWKIATASEPASYQVTAGTNRQMGGTLLVIRGANFQRGPGGAVQPLFIFDANRTLSRSGSLITQGNGPHNASDFAYDRYLMVAAFCANLLATTVNLSAPSGTMTQRSNLALSGVSQLVATEVVHVADNPDVGTRSCTVDNTSATGRGWCILIGDDTDDAERNVEDLVGATAEADATPPTITNVSPTPGTELASRDTPITFTVADTAPGLRAVVVTCRYTTIPGTFVVHDGTSFRYPFDSADSARTAVAGGYDFTILPRGGWPADIDSLHVYAVDQSGNLEGGLP